MYNDIALEGNYSSQSFESSSSRKSVSLATTTTSTSTTEDAAHHNRAEEITLAHQPIAGSSSGARRSDRLSHRAHLSGIAPTESFETNTAHATLERENASFATNHRARENAAQTLERFTRASSVDLVGLMDRLHTATDSTETGSGECVHALLGWQVNLHRST